MVRYDDEGSPSPCGHYGWSMSAGELKKALESVPDDYEVMLTNAEVDDIDISSVRIDNLYLPFEDSPGLLILGGGQILNHEYGFEERMDRYHEGLDKTKAWNVPAGEPMEWWER